MGGLFPKPPAQPSMEEQYALQKKLQDQSTSEATIKAEAESCFRQTAFRIQKTSRQFSDNQTRRWFAFHRRYRHRCGTANFIRTGIVHERIHLQGI